MTKIIHDAGHGYNTAGKRVPDGTMREWEFNSAVATLVTEALEGYKNVEQIRVDDPTGRSDVSLRARTDRANAYGGDVYISYHANAFGNGQFNSVGGIETYIHPNASAESKVIANAIHKELLTSTGRNDRRVKTANFFVVRETKMPALLLEMGFMTNREEAELLKSSAYRKTCADAIVKALVAHFKLAEKPKPKTTKKTDTFYRVVTGSFGDKANAEMRAQELQRKGFDSFIDAVKK